MQSRDLFAVPVFLALVRAVEAQSSPGSPPRVPLFPAPAFGPAEVIGVVVGTFLMIALVVILVRPPGRAL